MRSTLEQYIAPENIPKKYGGTLDYNFGELPNIEPAIDNVLKWHKPHVLKTRNTIPTGPIRWERTRGDDLVAVAVGSEKGKQRNDKVATLHVTQGIAQASIGAGANSALYRTTSGIDTHPPSPPQSQIDLPTPPAEDSELPESSRAGNYTIPLRDAEPREGTSGTRFQAQQQTHAHNQQIEGTPNMRDNGYGDKNAVMEPGTVGQAPKTHPMPRPEEPQQPSYMDQAKNLAGEAYDNATGAAGAAMAALGYGGNQQKEEPKEDKRIPEDPRVAQMPQKNVEEFLRSQYNSKPSGH